MFAIQVAISDRFPSLNPLALRQAPMREFCLLAARLLEHQRAEKRRARRKDWRPAGDTWF